VALLAFVAVLVAIAGMAAYVSWEFAHTSVATSSKGTESVSDFVILVSPGDSLVHVAETLQQNRIITSSKLFLWFARFKGQYGALKHGEYLVKGDMTPGKILEVITSGRSIEKSLTIAEGLNLFEIAQLVTATGIISREEFWSLTHDLEFIKSVLGEYGDGVRSLEGFLFPETYKYNRFTSGKALVMNMVRQSLSVLKVYEADMKKAGLSPSQTLTMASIVEKETGKSEERPLIASVFFNRLKKNMRFQTDPTVLYAKMLVSNKLENNISKADLSNDHPYNTRSISLSTRIEHLECGMRHIYTCYTATYAKKNCTHTSRQLEIYPKDS
jgi:UPF0755 protein